jgi:hypothetical protein
MTKITPAFLLVAFAAASGAQEPPPKPSGSSLEAVEVEALALSSHNRLQELEAQPEQETVAVAVEKRLAKLEQQVEKIPETPAIASCAPPKTGIGLGYCWVATHHR